MKRSGLPLMILAACLGIGLAWIAMREPDVASIDVGANESAPEVPAPQVSSAGVTPPSVDKVPLGPSQVIEPAEVVHEARPEWTGVSCGFTGRVVSAAGEPVPGATVSIRRVSIGRGFGQRPAEGPADFGRKRTDAEGRFTIGRIRSAGVFALAAHAGSAGRGFRLVDAAPQPDEIVEVGDVVLRHSGVVKGRVVSNGKPVPDAMVRCLDVEKELIVSLGLHYLDLANPLVGGGSETGPPSVFPVAAWMVRALEDFPIAAARTDVSGHFELRHVVGGAGTLIVHREGYMGHAQAVRVAAAPVDVGDVELERGKKLIVRTVEETGQPVSCSDVLATPFYLGVTLRLRSAAKPGEYEGFGFPGTRVLVMARRGPGDSWIFSHRSSLERPVRLLVGNSRHPPGSSAVDCTVSVVDWMDRPVPGCRIHSGAFPGLTHGATPQLRGTTGPDGVLSIRVSGRRVVILAEHPSLGTTAVTLAADTRSTRLRFQRPGSIAGRVHGPGADRCTVAIGFTRTAWGDFIHKLEVIGAAPGPEFEFRGLQPGAYGLVVVPKSRGLSSVGELWRAVLRARAPLRSPVSVAAGQRATTVLHVK